MPAVPAYTRTMLFPKLLAALLVVAVTVPSAAERTLSLSEVDEAIRLGQTRIAADRSRFHAPYRLEVGQPPVDYIETVTPYRRVVLAAEHSAQAGERTFGQRQALQLLTEADGQFDAVVEMTFHPLNTFVTMPAYEVVLMRGAVRVTPASLDRQARFGARVEGLPPPIPLVGGQIRGGASQPILGGSITARFKGEDVEPRAALDLAVFDGDKELLRVKIDLGRLR